MEDMDLNQSSSGSRSVSNITVGEVSFSNSWEQMQRPTANIRCSSKNPAEEIEK